MTLTSTEFEMAQAIFDRPDVLEWPPVGPQTTCNPPPEDSDFDCSQSEDDFRKLRNEMGPTAASLMEGYI